jgi:ribosomal protein S18 acetylase RimI-like enzyme
MVEIVRLAHDDWRRWRKLRLAALEDAPHAFSSTLADWQGDGDNEQRWRERLISVPFNVIAKLVGRPVGMVSASWPDEDGNVTLMSMWVSPSARGQGVGDALVDAVLVWADEQSATNVALNVVATNDAALGLYRRNGFTRRVVGQDDPQELELVRRIARGF